MELARGRAGAPQLGMGAATNLTRGWLATRLVSAEKPRRTTAPEEEFR